MKAVRSEADAADQRLECERLLMLNKNLQDALEKV